VAFLGHFFKGGRDMFFDMGTANKKQEIQDSYDMIIIGGEPAEIPAGPPPIIIIS